MGGLEQQDYHALLLNEGKEKPDVEQVCETAYWCKTEGFNGVEMMVPNRRTADDSTMEALEGLVAMTTENELLEKEQLALAHYDFNLGKKSEPLVVKPAHAQRDSDQSRSKDCALSMQQQGCLAFENYHNTLEMLQPNLCLETSRSFNALGEVDSREREERAFEGLDRQSSQNMITPEDASQVAGRPCPIASTGSLEMNDCGLQLNVSDCLLLSNKNCVEEGLRVANLESWKDHGDGSTGRCKVFSSPPSDTEASANCLSAIPGTSNLVLPKNFEYEADSMKIDTEDRISKSGDDNAGYVDYQVPPLVADYGKVTKANRTSKSTSISDGKGRSTYTSDEDGVISEAEEMVRFKKGTPKATRQCKNSGHGALDLLVNAIQATTGSLCKEEDNKKEEKGGRKDRHDPQLWSVEAHFVYGRSPIVKKRVLRRAKSAFKKPASKESVEEILELQVSLSVAGPSSHRRGRNRPTSEQQQQQGSQNERTGNNPPSFEAELVKDGAPVIRSKRGRSQALPVRFYDSVLQPWKRKSRTQRKGKLQMS